VDPIHIPEHIRVGWWEGERPGCGWRSQKEWGSLFQGGRGVLHIEKNGL